MEQVVLLKDVNYFGKIIRRGSFFRRIDNDWLELWDNVNGNFVRCPTIVIHIANINEDYFVNKPK